MVRVTTTVAEELSNYLERLSKEVEGMKSIIAFMIETGKDIHGDSFLEYNKEYQEAFAAYDIAKSELQNSYIPADVAAKYGNDINWNLDYATRELVIEYKGSKLTQEEFEALLKL